MKPKNLIQIELSAEFQALRELAITSDSNVKIYEAVEALEKKVEYYFGAMEMKEIIVRPETRW